MYFIKIGSFCVNLEQIKYFEIRSENDVHIVFDAEESIYINPEQGKKFIDFLNEKHIIVEEEPR